MALIFDKKMNGSHAVSVVTLVGQGAHKLCDEACNLLSKSNIFVENCTANSQSLMLMLSPDFIDEAANILHDIYVISNERSNIQQKQVF